jgi:hypothetical protein
VDDEYLLLWQGTAKVDRFDPRSAEAAAGTSSVDCELRGCGDEAIVWIGEGRLVRSSAQQPYRPARSVTYAAKMSAHGPTPPSVVWSGIDAPQFSKIETRGS